MNARLHFTNCFEGATATADAPLVIKRCKILGMESKWGRKFTDQAMQDAISRGLYEGLPIYRNHPKVDYSNPTWNQKPLPPRDVEDVLGYVENIAYEPGKGLFGDVRFTVDDKLTRSVCESATTNPRLYGFSHHAVYESHMDGQLEIVDKIAHAHSVDLVTKPATTNGLFEGDKMPEENKTPKTIKQIFESVPLGYAKKILSAFEDEPYMAAEVPMQAEAPSIEEQINAALRTAFMAIYDDAGLDDKAKLSKMKDLFNAKGKLNGSTEPAEGVSEAKEGETTAEEKKDEKKNEAESTTLPIGTVEAVALLEKHKLPISKTAIESYAILPAATAANLAAREESQAKEVAELNERLKLSGDKKPASLPRYGKIEGDAPEKKTAKDKAWMSFCSVN